MHVVRPALRLKMQTNQHNFEPTLDFVPGLGNPPISGNQPKITAHQLMIPISTPRSDLEHRLGAEEAYGGTQTETTCRSIHAVIV
jgi:hypothetical protein